MAQAAVLVLPVGVHHGERGRQRLGAEVVIEHHHIRPCRRRDGLVRERAAIDAEDQVVRLGQRLHGGHVRAVALVDPVGDIERGRAPERPEPDDQQRGGRAAVHVVVGEDRDPLAPGHGLQQPRGGGCHVLQRQRVGQQVAQRGREETLGLGGGDAPPHQRAAERERQARGLRHRLGQPVLLGEGPTQRRPVAEVSTPRKARAAGPVISPGCGSSSAGPSRSSTASGSFRWSPSPARA